MDVFLSRTLEEALEVKGRHPEALPIAGGTDVMVELNFDRHRPEAILDVSRIPELQQWRRENGAVFLGAGVTYSRIMRELNQFAPWVQASRTIGSPQIRNRGTVGGNLGTSSPAGDALPVIAAHDADVVLARAGGLTRSVPWHDFMVGPKKNTLQPDELIIGTRWKALLGPGSFSKIGTRNAMVISMAGLCLLLDEEGRTVRVALGSVAPTIVRAPEAEALAGRVLAEAGAWDDPAATVSEQAVDEFGELVASAIRPIDDVRGTAAYRRHACRVLARRALRWALADRRRNGGPGG
ncbi:MAG TPA: FAD binding domain-containing protein [Actinomycetota bacterium]